jgi:hypothetical protein
MAVRGEVQSLPRRGITLSPLRLVLLSVLLTAAGVMGVLVGRWTAPSTTGTHRAEIIAPGWAAEAFVPGVTDFPSSGSSEYADPFVPGVTDFPSSGSSEYADPFVPGVTDFPSSGSSEHADPFVPGVTDFGH